MLGDGMESIDFIIYSIKIIYFCICVFYIIRKLLNEKMNISFLPVYVILISVIVTIIKAMFHSTYSSFVLCICIAFVFKRSYKLHFGTSFLLSILAFAINFVTFGISVILIYLFQEKLNLEVNKIISLFFIITLHIPLLLSIFKIRKFKNGLTFLKNLNSEYLDITMYSIGGIIVYLYSFITFDGENITKFLVQQFFLFSVIIVLIIQKSITLFYKQKNLLITVKDYESQIKEKDEQLKKLDDEKYKISKLNHEFYNRQKALMLKVEDALANMNFEAGEDINLKEKIQELSNEYTNKALENRVGSNFPKTGVEEIDDMFTYMHMECKKCGIEFVLQVSGNINFLINNYIEKSKLVTLIGDHLRDAIIAVNCSKNKYKSILVILGIKDDNYEFCIYDSGIEFEIETLEKLGIEPATTHKDCGGSGIGFMTTFETLKETKASFVLEELNELKEDCYTKAVKFIFDGKEALEINSYRADLLRKYLKFDRYKINNI